MVANKTYKDGQMLSCLEENMTINEMQNLNRDTIEYASTIIQPGQHGTIIEL